ncbi:MAG: hypothetical protein FWE76_05920, partial [Symbiobacteriaceae bacterium]|nr:hypothetical protein [Symbiobacteriaceae bacterium]
MSLLVGKGIIGPAATDEHAISLVRIINAMGHSSIFAPEGTWETNNLRSGDDVDKSIPSSNVWNEALYRLYHNDLTPIRRDKTEEVFVINGYVVSFTWPAATEKSVNDDTTVEIKVDGEYFESFYPEGINLEDTYPGSYRCRVNEFLKDFASFRPPLWSGVSCAYVVHTGLLGDNVHDQLARNMTTLLEALDYDVVFSLKHDESTNQVTRNGAIPTFIKPEDWETCLWMLRERIAIPAEGYFCRKIYCVNGHTVEIGAMPLGNREYFTEGDEDTVIYPIDIDGVPGYRLLIPVT